jgi:hypothetical protein
MQGGKTQLTCRCTWRRGWQLTSVTPLCYCFLSTGLLLFVHLCLRFQVSLLLFVPSYCVFLLVPCVFFYVLFFLYRLFVLSPSSISGVGDEKAVIPFPPWPSLAFIKPEDGLCFFEKKQGNEILLPWFLSVPPCSGGRRW